MFIKQISFDGFEYVDALIAWLNDAGAAVTRQQNMFGSFMLSIGTNI